QGPVGETGPAGPVGATGPAGPQGPVGPAGADSILAYAQFSTAGSTFTDGTALPLTLTVDGTNGLIVPAATSATLTEGVYLIHYELTGTLSTAGQALSVTPNLNGTPLAPYVTEFTGSDGSLTGTAQSTFLLDVPASGVLAFNFSTDDESGLTDANFNVTVIKIDE
ncbi:MAG: collagen-like protein, partial [Clostridia bacterium]|nr:collagen-like protein [Clostridia bacterium]